MSLNTRRKGQRIEFRCQELLKASGYEVIRLWQPRYAPQAPIDLVAFGFGRLRLIQVKANQARDTYKRLKAWLVPDRVVVTKELWVWKNGEPEPRQRVVE